MNLTYEIYFLYFEQSFNMPENLPTWGQPLYFPSKGRLAADFYHP
jgi:hypothetical protein